MCLGLAVLLVLGYCLVFPGFSDWLFVYVGAGLWCCLVLWGLLLIVMFVIDGWSVACCLVSGTVCGVVVCWLFCTVWIVVFNSVDLCVSLCDCWIGAFTCCLRGLSQFLDLVVCFGFPLDHAVCLCVVL